jgi:glucose-6-phosphate isomerase
LLTTVGGALRLGEHGVVAGANAQPDLTVNGPLGAQFLTWEYATAVAGKLLGINPFDQPNVAESKQNTADILDTGSVPESTPLLRIGDCELHGDPALFGQARNTDSAIASLIGAAGERGYIAIMAYLDRIGDAAVAELRVLLARRTSRPVTFGWGPRFLHSTGQYHKGGPANGAFLQLTGAVHADLAIPGKSYSFAQLQAAQAAGDRTALTGRGFPLLHIHLSDRKRGIDELLETLR